MSGRLSEKRAVFLFSWIAKAFFLPASVEATGSLQCPALVQVELGTNGVIACNISFEFKNLYWYRGESFSDYPPIIRFQDGVPEKGDQFEITPGGALVILNTDVSREGIYTVVVFRLNTVHEYASIFLKIFANPQPYFPLFQRCNGKQNCSLKADLNGSVKCTIHGARPAFELNLESKGVNLVNFTQKNITDKSTGLTNTSMKAYYVSTACVDISNITCIATGTEMQEVKSTLTFQNTCSPISPMKPKGKKSAGTAVVIVLVIIMVAIAVAVVTFYFIRKRRHDYQKVNKTEVEVGSKDNSNTNALELSKEHSVKKRNIKENRDILLNALFEKYREDYYGNHENLDDSFVSIDNVYIDTDFEMKDDDGKTSTLKIRDILERSLINDGKMRLFVSNKMQLTFSSYFACLWSEQEKKDNVLLVFHMKDVSYHTTITKALKEMLQDTIPLSEEDLFKIIEKFGCHIILEGVELERLFRNGEGGDSHEVVIQSEDDTPRVPGRREEQHVSFNWTIDNILTDHRKKNLRHKISHWVVTFDPVTIDTNPYKVVTMKDVPLFIDKVEDYIQNVVSYYSTEEEHIKQVEFVQKVLSNSDVKKKFEKSIILLLQMIHLIVKQVITKQYNGNYISITSLMIRSLTNLKRRYARKFPTVDEQDLATCEEQLGEVAFNQMTGTGSDQPTISDDVIDFSKSIGLIKHSSSAKQINFSGDDVECFFIASFLKNKKQLSDFVNITKTCEGDASSDKRFRVLPFICALQPSFSGKICEIMLQEGKMKYFLNCFCETTNADGFCESIRKHLEKGDSSISIYGDKNNLTKLKCLLQYCSRKKIIVNQVNFERISQKNAHIIPAEMFGFEMPVVRRITFSSIQLDDEEGTFVENLKWIVTQNVENVSFDDCRLPDLSTDIKAALLTVFNQHKSTVVVQKTENQGNFTITYSLNKEKIKWEKKNSKANKKKDKDTKGGKRDNKHLNQIEPCESTPNKEEKETTGQSPENLLEVDTSEDKATSLQFDLTGSAVGDINSDVKNPADMEPSTDTKPEDKLKDVGLSTGMNKEVGVEVTIATVEPKMGEKSKQPSESKISQPFQNKQESGNTNVLHKCISDDDDLIKDGPKEAAELKDSGGISSAK